MVVASLHHFLHGQNRMLASAAIVVAMLVVLSLLGYAVFGSGLTADHLPESPLMGPFRWLSITNMA